MTNKPKPKSYEEYYEDIKKNSDKYRDQAVKTLVKAKSKLILSQEFFASLVMSYETVYNEQLPPWSLAATDGLCIYYGPHFGKLKIGEAIFVLCHEVMHNVLNHITRAKHCHLCWNVATDLLINNMLHKAMSENKLDAKAPQGILHAKDTPDETAERLYYKYHVHPEIKCYICGGGQSGSGGGQQQQGGNGGDKEYEDDYAKATGGSKPMDGHLRPKRGAADNKQVEQKARETLSRAVSQAKARGLVPGAFESLIQEMLYPQMNWYEVLLDYLQSLPDDYTFKPPDRRFEDIVLPVMNDGDTVTGIVVAIDTSGSLSDDELSEFITEVIHIKHQFPQVKFTFLMCDAEIQKVIDVDDGTDPNELLRVKGRGGTAFEPVFKWVKENEPDTQCLVYLTDGFAPFPPDPQHEVIWIINNKEQTPGYGRIVRYQRKGNGNGDN